MPDINGIPYVESTDLVSGWPTVSQSVAQEVSDQLASKLDLAGGKILQIVRATDGTERTLVGASFTDVTGMSVTITPQKSDSAILIIASFVGSILRTVSTDDATGYYQITDASNNGISGATETEYAIRATRSASANLQRSDPVLMVAYATPATTSATTYKLRFRTSTVSEVIVVNKGSLSVGQMYAIEVSA